MLSLPAGRCGTAGMGKMLTGQLQSPHCCVWSHVAPTQAVQPNHPISADSQGAGCAQLWADQQQFLPGDFEEFEIYLVLLPICHK